MRKNELVEIVAEKAGVNKKEVSVVIDATIEAIQNALSSGDSIQFVGFGTFQVKERAAKAGRNPKTGELIDIPASRVASFKVGKTLKEAVK